MVSLRAGAVLLVILATTGNRAETSNDAAAARIQRLEQDLAGAIVAIDVDAIRRIEASSYIYTGSDAQVGRREDFIRGYLAGNRVRSIAFEDLVVDVYGDAAVVRGVQRVERAADGVTLRRVSRYTRFYVRFPQGWQAVAGHSSAIVPPSEIPAP